MRAQDDRPETSQDEIDALAVAWRAELEPRAVTVLELSKRVARIGGLIERAVRAELDELGLTYAEFDVLAALVRAGEPYRMRPSELSRSLLLTTGGISNVLHRLGRAGYVSRESHRDDGRSRWVTLTDDGERLARMALAASNRAHADLMRDVPDPVARNAADALRQVLLSVDRRYLR